MEGRKGFSWFELNHGGSTEICSTFILNVFSSQFLFLIMLRSVVSFLVSGIVSDELCILYRTKDADVVPNPVLLEFLTCLEF